MKINVYPDTCAKTGIPVMEAFVKGLSKHTVHVKRGTDIDDCDFAVVWSFLFQFNKDREYIYNTYRSMGVPVVILEVGALKRGTTWKVGLNGINNNAIWPDLEPHTDRWESFGIEPRPWRASGTAVVLCGQNDRSGAWSGPPMSIYIRDTIEQLREYTDRPIIIRPHPRCAISINGDTPLQRPLMISPDKFDFETAIRDAWAVVSFNSNPGIEAVINGVPVICDQSSLASPVGNIIADVEAPYEYDREEWLTKLAYTEWSISEIQDGVPWNRLLDKIEKAH